KGVATEYCVRPTEAVVRTGGDVGGLLFESRGARRQIEVDGVWMSVGFAPANALLYQANTRMSYSLTVEQFVPRSLPPGVFACGKVNGVYAFDARLADGAYAGGCAAAGLGLGTEPDGEGQAPLLECPTHPYPIFPHPDGREFIDFDEDLQIKDL